MKKLFLLLLSLYTFHFILLTYPTSVSAIYDPLSVPNNKFGIHLIQATPDESSPAAQMVNSHGDWGYITFLIESKDRDKKKWQDFFNDLRRRHLIPIVRLATKPLDEHWERPYEGEEQAWADFLDSLNWPTKNRYVIIYNEPNQGREWGNFVDAKNYSKILDKTITALKTKNRDFFVLNGGFDASAPSKPPLYEDQVMFMQQMEEVVPGIFSKLDGWVSHSYPNPGFVGLPDAFGKGTVRTWYWELQILQSLGVTKNLPVFITETGWKHAEGINLDPSLHTAEVVASYYKNAFESAWNSDKIVAITPFLLSYQDAPFDHFSFKKYTGEKQKQKLVGNTPAVLGVQYPEYYPQYQTIVDLGKVAGKPVQENKAQLTSGEVYSSIVSGQEYQIALTFKNTGQSIWGDQGSVKLVALKGGKELAIESMEIPQSKKVEPGEEYTFSINLHAPSSGSFKISLNLFNNDKQFDSPPVEFTTEVKQPVILQILNKLRWKKNAHGEYILKVSGAIGDSAQKVLLDSSGKSEKIEARYLLPNYTFEFSLERPFYKSKTIKQKVLSGANTLDFGTLEPDIFSALIHPKELWKLLPFSN